MAMENPVWMCVKTKNYNTCMYSKLNLEKKNTITQGTGQWSQLSTCHNSWYTGGQSMII